MVPPPGSTGDEFPDFDKMTFEEQMAWLESLAKRQGAREEELTTAANIDVPVPEDAEIDEPGYVPFEGSRSAREAKEGKSVSPEQKSQPPVQPPAPEPAPAESQAAAPADDFQVLDWDTAEAAVDKSADPMQWLDSLTAQSGEDLGSLFASTGAQESEDLGEFADLFSGLEDIAETPDLPLEPEPAAPPVESAPVETSAETSVDDLLGGMDPMRWLESLAARQGASQDELTTSADLDIEVPSDAVIDEPGYVPFEGSRSARDWGKPIEPEPEPEVPVEPAFEEAASADFPELELAWETPAEPEVSLEAPVDFFEPVELSEASEPVGADELTDLLGGADPMTWLESLARRKGARSEELTTAADLAVPELPEDTVVDEPGYVPYSAFDIRPSAAAEAPEPPRASVELPPSMPEPVEEFAEEAELESLDESLSWLEDLAAEPAEGLSGYLAVEDEQPEAAVAEAEVEAEPPAPSAQPADPLAGMTDEDIAYAQAKGLLTGEQELAWLKRQAAKLAETRQSQEMAEVAPESVAPAELAPELPDWLQGMRPEAEAEAEAPQALLDDFSLLSEAPDWLSEAVPEGEPDLSEIASVTAELSLDEDVEQLWAEEISEEAPVLESDLIPDSELAAFLRGDLAPEAPDLLAEALDAEYDRRIDGDESEPDWYTEAVAKAAAEAPAIQDTELQVPASSEPALSESASLDMPGWLMESEADLEPLPLTADMPAWLLEETPAAEAEADKSEASAWLTEAETELPPAEPAEALPDWLNFEQPVSAEVGWSQEEVPVAEAEEAQPEAEMPPQPVQPEPEPPPAPKVAAPPVPEAAPAPVSGGDLYDQYRRRLEQDPNDHVNRLAFARSLHGSQSLVPSLEQYETLIDSAQLLPDVADDLSSLAQDYPEVPRVRRLLGDAYMRRGMLQEALNAYRSALEQL